MQMSFINWIFVAVVIGSATYWVRRSKYRSYISNPRNPYRSSAAPIIDASSLEIQYLHALRAISTLNEDPTVQPFKR